MDKERRSTQEEIRAKEEELQGMFSWLDEVTKRRRAGILIEEAHSLKGDSPDGKIPPWELTRATLNEKNRHLEFNLHVQNRRVQGRKF